MNFVRKKLMSIIDWRVRDQIDHERTATVELGRTFVDASIEMTERFLTLESEVASLRHRIDELEKRINE
jgi:hypothetical protein